MFLSKQARLGIITWVAFLSTRLRDTNEDNKKKLSRILKYLEITWYLFLTLDSYLSVVIKWWVDAAFSVHRDMSNHEGGAVSMGKYVIYS